MAVTPMPDEPWSPDENLVEKAKSNSGLSIKDLTDADRAWVVAALGRQGWTAQEIADRLRCSLRLVWQIKASPITAVVEYLMDDQERARSDTGTNRLELVTARQSADQRTVEADTMRRQRNDLVTQLSIERNGKHTTMATKAHPRLTCTRCDNLLGHLSTHADIKRGMHALCAWANESDWRAISSWVRGHGNISGS